MLFTGLSHVQGHILRAFHSPAPFIPNLLPLPLPFQPYVPDRARSNPLLRLIVLRSPEHGGGRKKGRNMHAFPGCAEILMVSDNKNVLAIVYRGVTLVY